MQEKKSLKIHVLVITAFCWPNSKKASLALCRGIDHVRNQTHSSLKCLSGFTSDNKDKCKEKLLFGKE